jgi:hypothetical protein
VQAYNALLAGTIEHVLICYGRKSKEAEEAEAQVQAAKRKFKK